MPEDSDYVFVFSSSDARRYQNNRQSSSPSLSNFMSSSTTTYNFQQQRSPPSYEEAIRNSINPTSIIVNSVIDNSSLVRNIQPLNEIVVDNNNESESQYLLNNYKNNGNNYYYDTNKTSSPEEENLSPPPDYTISDANFEGSSEGVTSYDSKLNLEPESLYRFMIAHNDKPEMAIKIHGYHHETRVSSHSYTDSNGNVQHVTNTEAYPVTDFLIRLDLTEYVLPNGRIYATSKLNKDPDLEIMEIINEYINHKNKLKEILMKKIIIWDYETLTKAISTAIRQGGYHNNIEITYPIKNHIVKVQSDHKFARFTRNFWTRLLCFLTCLWIIFWPLSWLYKKSFKNKIKSDFYMSITPRNWYDQNINIILTNVKWL